MSIQITITGPFDVKSIFSQLTNHGWTLNYEGDALLIVYLRPIEINGKEKSVQAFKWTVTVSRQQIIFQTMGVPRGSNVRTGYSVFRVLAGRIVSDIIRNDCLKVMSYNLTFGK